MEYRKAKLSDAEAIYNLVYYYADKGMMLHRARNHIYENIRDYIVAEKDGQIIGVGALHVMWEDLAEVRTLAVHNEYLRQGIGRKIVNLLLADAAEMGVKKVFTLTYQPEFFAACGFKEEDKNAMPQKVWTDCINCPKFPNCDEVCMSLLF